MASAASAMVLWPRPWPWVPVEMAPASVWAAMTPGDAGSILPSADSSA